MTSGRGHYGASPNPPASLSRGASLARELERGFVPTHPYPVQEGSPFDLHNCARRRAGIKKNKEGGREGVSCVA
eukprot:3125237-Amphidinium_carterae.1